MGVNDTHSLSPLNLLPPLPPSCCYECNGQRKSPKPHSLSPSHSVTLPLPLLSSGNHGSSIGNPKHSHSRTLSDYSHSRHLPVRTFSLPLSIPLLSQILQQLARTNTIAALKMTPSSSSYLNSCQSLSLSLCPLFAWPLLSARSVQLSQRHGQRLAG